MAVSVALGRSLQHRGPEPNVSRSLRELGVPMRLRGAEVFGCDGLCLRCSSVVSGHSRLALPATSDPGASW